MGLSQFKIDKHELYPIFKKNKIPLAVIAQHAGITYNYCSNILNGHCNATDEVNRRLHRFAKEVQK
jgi:hypothetical protein